MKASPNAAKTQSASPTERPEEAAAPDVNSETDPAKGSAAKKAGTISYHDLDEAILHMADAHALACWLDRAGFRDLDEFKTWQPEPQMLRALAEEIVCEFASCTALDMGSIDAAARETKKKGTEAQKDGTPTKEPKSRLKVTEENQLQVFENTVRQLRDSLTYYELRMAIKAGDVGRMEDLLPSLAVFFKGSGNHKYAIQMLETLQLMKYEYPPEYA